MCDMPYTGKYYSRMIIGMALMLWSSVVLAVAPPTEKTPRTFPAWDNLDLLFDFTVKAPESVMVPKDVSGYPDKLDGRLWQLVVEARTRKSPDVQAKAWTLGVPYEDDSTILIVRRV